MLCNLQGKSLNRPISMLEGNEQTYLAKNAPFCFSPAAKQTPLPKKHAARKKGAAHKKRGRQTAPRLWLVVKRTGFTWKCAPAQHFTTYFTPWYVAHRPSQKTWRNHISRAQWTIHHKRKVTRSSHFRTSLLVTAPYERALHGTHSQAATNTLSLSLHPPPTYLSDFSVLLALPLSRALSLPPPALLLSPVHRAPLLGRHRARPVRPGKPVLFRPVRLRLHQLIRRERLALRHEVDRTTWLLYTSPSPRD